MTDPVHARAAFLRSAARSLAIAIPVVVAALLLKGRGVAKPGLAAGPALSTRTQVEDRGTQVQAEDRAAPEESAIAGSVRGRPFDHVASAFVIESPDSDGATVIYLLSKEARCVDLSFSGWDRSIPRGTTVLELEVLGTAPGACLVVPAPAPSSREATAEYARTSVEGAANEVRATGGWITLDTLGPRGPATGRVELDFGAEHLAGTFRAVFCRGGHEP